MRIVGCPIYDVSAIERVWGGCNGQYLFDDYLGNSFDFFPFRNVAFIIGYII
jgi:hypothetical protein